MATVKVMLEIDIATGHVIAVMDQDGQKLKGAAEGEACMVPHVVGIHCEGGGGLRHTCGGGKQCVIVGQTHYCI